MFDSQSESDVTLALTASESVESQQLRKSLRDNYGVYLSRAGLTSVLAGKGIHLGIQFGNEQVSASSSKTFEYFSECSVKGICDPFLQLDSLKHGNKTLPGLACLQIVSSRDISSPLIHQDYNSKRDGRMLFLSLTDDGNQRISAIEFSSCHQITLQQCAPGTKVILKDAKVRDGIICLTPECIVGCYGQVERLLTSWKLKQQREINKIIQTALDEGEMPPPKFLPFVAATATAAMVTSTATKPPPALQTNAVANNTTTPNSAAALQSSLPQPPQSQTPSNVSASQQQANSSHNHNQLQQRHQATHYQHRQTHSNAASNFSATRLVDVRDSSAQSQSHYQQHQRSQPSRMQQPHSDSREDRASMPAADQGNRAMQPQPQHQHQRQNHPPPGFSARPILQSSTPDSAAIAKRSASSATGRRHVDILLDSEESNQRQQMQYAQKQKAPPASSAAGVPNSQRHVHEKSLQQQSVQSETIGTTTPPSALANASASPSASAPLTASLASIASLSLTSKKEAEKSSLSLSASASASPATHPQVSAAGKRVPVIAFRKKISPPGVISSTPLQADALPPNNSSASSTPIPITDNSFAHPAPPPRSASRNLIYRPVARSE